MAASVQIDESNGSGETVTSNISNSNMGSLDAPNLTPANDPIIPGNYSYAKYQRLHVTNMNGSSKIDDVRIWRDGDLGGDCQHLTNARTSSYSQKTYAQPVAAAIVGVDQAMPTADPGSANIGIGGDLAGALTAIGFSDYIIHQLLTGANDIEGADPDFNIKYGEIL